MYDIVGLGELLVDFTTQGKSAQGNPIYEANPGGAPYNVLAAASKLGRKTAFIGKVGNDDFGRMLKKDIEGRGINSDSLYLTDEFFTSLAFVTLDEKGNRSFSFARKPGADTRLEPDEVDEELIKSAGIFHCGTLSMTEEPARSASLKALKTAKRNGVLVSCDPNIRLSLWKNPEQARDTMMKVLDYGDIIKISEDELEFLYGSGDTEKNAKRLINEYYPKLIFITCGAAGAYAVNKNAMCWHPSFTNLPVLDTTGAGDCFCGAALSELLKLESIDEAGEMELFGILRYASAAAGLCCTRYGGAGAVPDEAEIRALLMKGL